MKNDVITPHSARVQEILKHMRAKRARSAQEKTWRRLRQQGASSVQDEAILLQIRDRVAPEFLREGMWKGRRCFVIGGGISLKGFDFGRLRGELVIAINRAFEYIDADIMLALDKGVYEDIKGGKYGDSAREKFERYSGLRVWCGERFPDTFYLRNNGIHGLSANLADGLSTGGNTGYAAVNLAILLGANPIYLLGFDMAGNARGETVQFHPGYHTNQAATVYDEFMGHFNAVAPEIKKRGVEVVNLNPESRLRCFSFGKVDEIQNLGGEAIYFDGCLGFGDNFEQRPLVRHLTKKYKTVYVKTAIPEVYWDIPGLKFVYPQGINLRTQRKHLRALSGDTWSPAPRGVETMGWRQGFPRQTPNQLQTNIARHVKDKYGIQDYDFLFPVRTTWIETARELVASLDTRGKKICIIRQPTDRREWSNKARNPKTEYFQLLIDRYKDEYFFINIADLKEGEEWFEKALTGIDAEFVGGQLSMTTIFGLMKIADMIIAFPGFFLPAAIAIRARCFMIFGGEAGPEMHVDPLMGIENLGWVAPDPMCRCFNPEHECNKEISEKKLIAAFEELRARPRVEKIVTVGTPPGLGDTLWVMTKMESFKERLGIDRLKVAICNNGLHKYTPAFLELLPFVDGIEGRARHFNLTPFYEKTKPLVMLKNYEGTDYFMDAGGALGIWDTPLEDILPEYETNWHLPIRYSEDARGFALKLKDENGGKFVLFYPSAIGNNNIWNSNAWPDEAWIRLAKLLHEQSGVRPYLIGAPFDKDHSLELKRRDPENILQDITGETDLPQVLALFREANLLVGFSSGLAIIGTMIGTPVVTFWPIQKISPCGRFHEAFMWTWVPPEARKNGRYIPLPYGGPNTTPEWIAEQVKEFI